MIFVVHVSLFEEIIITYKIFSENLEAEHSRRLQENITNCLREIGSVMSIGLIWS